MDRIDLINIQSDKTNEKEAPRNGALIKVVDGVRKRNALIYVASF